MVILPHSADGSLLPATQSAKLLAGILTALLNFDHYFQTDPSMSKPRSSGSRSDFGITPSIYSASSRGRAIALNAGPCPRKWYNRLRETPFVQRAGRCIVVAVRGDNDRHTAGAVLLATARFVSSNDTVKRTS